MGRPTVGARLWNLLRSESFRPADPVAQLVGQRTSSGNATSPAPSAMTAIAISLLTSHPREAGHGREEQECGNAGRVEEKEGGRWLVRRNAKRTRDRGAGRGWRCPGAG